MKIIKAGYQFITEKSITKKIERVARVCYKSEDKIGVGTDTALIGNLIKKQHLAMLEHGDACLEVSKNVYDLLTDVIDMMENRIRKNEETKKCYLRRTEFYLGDGVSRYIVSGNIRAWYEFFSVAAKVEALPITLYDTVNNAVEGIFTSTIGQYELGIHDDVWGVCIAPYDCRLITDMSELTPQERMVHETISVLFTVDRGVTHELVRHREASFAQESTRYCCYSLGKFGNEITVILPLFFDTGMGLQSNSKVYEAWKYSCEVAERKYLELLSYGATPQQARTVLPSSTKADIVVTANLREWKHILNLRACDSTGPAHPQMKEVMVPLLQELQGNEYSFAFDDLKVGE